MPQVSIIIPTYRHRDTVAQALTSALAQTFVDREVIVVNDGSPDDTAEVLRPFVERGEVRYVEQRPNTGQGAARNRGINLAGGEFVALLDDDDLWPLDKLAWQVEALRSRPDAVLVYGYAQKFGDAEGRVPYPHGPAGRVRDVLLRGNFIVSPGQTLIRTDALRRIGGFDSDIWGLDDWDLYLRLAAIGDFIYEPRCGLHYRVHAGNASRDIQRMFVNARKVARKHLGWLPRLRQLKLWYLCRRCVCYSLIDHHVGVSRAGRREGRIADAVWHAGVAVLRWPPLLIEHGPGGRLFQRVTGWARKVVRPYRQRHSRAGGAPAKDVARCLSSGSEQALSKDVPGRSSGRNGTS